MPKQKPLWLIKLLNFEYWNMWTFYLPLLPYFLYLGFKTRSIAFISAVNRFKGKEDFIGEDKFAMIDDLPKEYIPINILVEAKTDFEKVKAILNENQLKYPLIAKPNSGERGFGVQKIESENQLKSYFENSKFDVILQELITFEIELGVFFIKKNKEEIGKVSSVTLKEFLSVVGNGTSTIEALIQQSDRARFQLEKFRKTKPEILKIVLAKSEKQILEPIGNHNKGTKFLNANYLINSQLNAVFDKISSQIEGFQYGRYDLKVASYEDLYAGKNIKIMEINGGFAEVTHIYNPNENIFKAYKDVMWHWNEGAKIAIENQKNGIKPISLSESIKRLRKHVAEQA
jgi:hypothetical protein